MVTLIRLFPAIFIGGTAAYLIWAVYRTLNATLQGLMT